MILRQPFCSPYNRDPCVIPRDLASLLTARRRLHRPVKYLAECLWSSISTEICYLTFAMRKAVNAARYMRDSPFALGIVFLSWAVSFPVWETVRVSLTLLFGLENADIIPYPVPMGLRWAIYVVLGGAMSLTSHYHAIHGHYGRWTLHSLFVLLGIFLAILTLVFVLFFSSITIMETELLWSLFLRDFGGSLGFKS